MTSSRNDDVTILTLDSERGPSKTYKGIIQSCLVNPDACVPTRIVRINESSGLSKHRISGKNKINLTTFYIMDNTIELADRYFS